MKIYAQIQFRLGLILLLISAGLVVTGLHGVNWPEMSAGEEQVSLARMLVATGNPGACQKRVPILTDSLNSLGSAVPPKSVTDPFSVKLLQQMRNDWE